MGQAEVKNQKAPEKPLKELVKDYTKQINAMKRQYQRERIKLEFNGKTMQRDLRKRIDKNEPEQARKMVAQQIIRNNQMINKYNNLDAKLTDVTFQLQQMCVNESMQNIMGGMAKIMSGANGKMKTADYTETMKRFMTEKQRMNVLNEYVNDVMTGDDDAIEDEDVDKLLGEMTREQAEKKIKKVQMDLEDYENKIGEI